MAGRKVIDRWTSDGVGVTFTPSKKKDAKKDNKTTPKKKGNKK